MQHPHQCCLWWGKELTLIYNAHYGDVGLIPAPRLTGDDSL